MHIRNLGCRIHEVEIPVDSDRTVQAAEAYSVYLPMLEECSRKCHAQTVRRLQSGAEFTAADYIQKRRGLDRLRRQAEQIFSEVDVLITPTAPVPAFTIAELESNLAQLRARVAPAAQHATIQCAGHSRGECPLRIYRGGTARRFADRGTSGRGCARALPGSCLRASHRMAQAHAPVWNRARRRLLSAIHKPKCGPSGDHVHFPIRDRRYCRAAHSPVPVWSRELFIKLL